MTYDSAHGVTFGRLRGIVSDIILARSRIETLGRCPRQWFHSYVDRLGAPGTSRDLQIGIWTHLGMELLLKSGGDIEAAIHGMPFPEGEDAEHKALSRALVLGWYRVRWPAFQEEFEILSVEKEVLVSLAPGFKLLARVDAVVEERASHHLYGFNWKTTSRTDGWVRKWRRDIQMFTESLSIEQDLGRPVAGMMVEGLYKGVWREGHWATPLIWGSRKEIEGGRFKYSEKRVPKWERFAIWEAPFPTAPDADPIAAWIGFLPQDLLEEYYVRTPPLLRNDEVVEEWLSGVLRREADARNIIASSSREEQLQFFRQEFSQWNCEGCAFSPICDGLATVESLAMAGLLVPRESPVDDAAERLGT